MIKTALLSIGMAILLLSACSVGKLKTLKTDDQEISIIFLQLNDVYEIAPLPGSNMGGLARVAAIRKQLLLESPRVFTILSGGLLSPTPINDLSIDGSKVNGRHMIEVLNSLGLDLVTFGNHEFDLDLESLQSGMDASNFLWFSSNIKRKEQDSLVPFTQEVYGHRSMVPETLILRAIDEDGTFLSVGFFGITLPELSADYASANDILSSSKTAFQALKPMVDFSVGITHLDYKDDILIAGALPELRMIMGGHDRQNMAQKIGKCLITKGDANAASVYIHRLTYHKVTKLLTVDSELLDMDESIAENPETADIVKKWQARTEEAFKEQGFDPNEIIARVTSTYDGRASALRSRQTNMGTLILNAMASVADTAECFILSSGSVRLDDVLKGKISQYDILRSMPLGAGIIEVEMDGRLLYQILTEGMQNRGSKGFLQMLDIDAETGINSFYAGKRKIVPGEKFIVGMPEYLLSGKENNMGFLTADHPEISNIWLPDPEDRNDLKSDVRKAVIAYMKNGGR